MSDPFDKSAPNRNGTSSRQIVTVAVLAIAFIGVLVFQFRGQPRSAEAVTGGAVAGAPDASGAPNIDPESASQAIALLADDPTAKLLRGTVEGPSPLDDIPTNPFILSPRWRAKLTRVTAPKALIVAPTPRGVDPGPAFDTSHIQVTMILKQGAGYIAIINGRATFTGAIVGGAKIIEIRPDRLICVQVAHPNAPPFEIMAGRPK